VHLVAGDFERCLAFAGKGDLVYLDPPYHPLSDTASFTSYTAAGFDAEDQRRLACLFETLDERGCQLMLSNSPTAFVRRLYNGYEQVEVQASRPISSKGDGRGAIAELLVTNGYRKA
jgi:DNA adenine methylase